MTLDECIKHCNEVAEYFENINEEELSIIYSDSTECIENQKAACMKYAEDYRQIAEWLSDYKKLKEHAEEYRQITEWLRDYKRLLEKEASQKENNE